MFVSIIHVCCVIAALVPKANAFVKKLRNYPHMYDREYAEARFGLMGPLVLP